MKHAILLVLALLVVACVPQSAAQTTTPTVTATPTAVAVVGGATSTPAPAGTATAQASPIGKDTAGAPQVDGWQRFSSRELEVEFEYPESCTLVVLDGSLAVGGRIELAVLEPEGLSLGDYVNRFADKRVKAGDWTVESIKDGVLGGQEAKTVDFRYGGTKRFGTATVTIRSGKVYVWSLTAGGFTCDEPNVYGRVLSSFKFAG